MQDLWTWMISNQSLPYRIALGATIFAALAFIDWRKHRAQATRWREYLFLLACVAIAIVYGIVNDLITSRISPEYFLFFKGVADHVGPEVAAHPELHRGELDLQAIRIGTLATWTAGLIAGAFLLTANSLGSKPRLPLTKLARFVPLLFALAIVFAIALGLIGFNGGLAWTSADFREMVANDEMHPYRLMAVYGIHLGGYLGSMIGLSIGVACIVVLRRRLIVATGDTNPSSA